MKAFQLDECFNSKRFSQGCNQEGFSEVVRFPEEFVNKSTSDSWAVDYCCRENRPLVTIDRTFASDNEKKIPDQHPGILILALSQVDKKEHFSLGYQTKMVWDFKNEFPEWNKINFSNSIITLTTHDITIRHMQQGELSFDEALDRAVEDWQKILIGRLNQNSTRG